MEQNMQKENSVEGIKKPITFKKKYCKVSFLALIIVVTMLAFFYAMISLYFNNHYYFHTTIEGIDCSLKTEDQVYQMLQQQFDDYKLILQGRNELQDSIKKDEIDLNYTLDSSFSQIIKGQVSYEWIIALVKEYQYTITPKASFDENKLSKKIKKLVFLKKENIVGPVNAYISDYNEETKQYTIISEIEGSDINYDVFEKKIIQAITEYQLSLDLSKEDCYIEPDVTRDDDELVEVLNTANNCLKAVIQYDWNSHQEVVNCDLISEWINIDSNGVTFDEDAIERWIAECAYKYDTYGKTRTFKTVAGVEKQLPSGGYGWSTNRSAELEQLEEDIKSGSSIERKPIYRYTAAQEGDNDIGDSYVEVDLTGQHVYLFIDGEMIYDTDCVSGNVARGNGTPEGVFGLTYKERNATLNGENYSTPVNFWMPFNGNIGLHDATWRSKFGGDIYLTSGSHGCINLPLEAAETIYGYIDKGFPVICYY